MCIPGAGPEMRLFTAAHCGLPVPAAIATCTVHSSRVAHFNSQVALAIGLAHVADEVMMVVAMAYSRTVTQGSEAVTRLIVPPLARTTVPRGHLRLHWHLDHDFIK